jgi:hypothetical protein
MSVAEEAGVDPAAPAGRSKVAVLLRRWPTALALAFSAVTFGGSDAPEGVYGLSEALLLLPLLYLVVAAAARRDWSWPVLIAVLGLFVALRGQDAVEPAVVILAVALAALLWGSAHGRHRQGMFRLQVVGMVAFGALALIGLAVAPDVARYVVAAGWLGHGLWDFAHLRANAVVSRSYAECCGVVDVLIAAELVLLPLLG